jgi:hypothetical protein
VQRRGGRVEFKIADFGIGGLAAQHTLDARTRGRATATAPGGSPPP